jgi:hypothetical protein
LKGQARIDEFAVILLGGIILIAMMLVFFTTPPGPVPEVSPRSVALKLQNGTSARFTLNVSRPLFQVNLTAIGAIKDWITFEKNHFSVIDFVLVPVTVSVPENVLPGEYRGIIRVTSEGGSVDVEVKVHVTREKILKSRTVPLGDFVLSFTNGTQAIVAAENLIVSRGYFGEASVIRTGKIDAEKLRFVHKASIELSVANTNSFGNLVIVLNGVEIFNKAVGIGEITIDVDTSLLQTNNEIVLRASPPGFLFWASTVYVIRDLKFSIDFKGGVGKDIDFSLTEEELQNFDHFTLKFRVADYRLPLPDLRIQVNGQTVFLRRPPVGFFDESFSKDVFGNSLMLDLKNKLSFSFDRQAFYAVADATLLVFRRSVT